MRRGIGEVALIAFIIAEILYLLAVGYLKAPAIIQPKQWIVPCASSAGGTRCAWSWEGCWRTATAPAWSDEEEDWICAV